jgi:hypothetical protein
MASKDFNKAFAAARKELGAGKTFTWQGKSYSTNVAGEGKAKGFSVDRASKAIDKAVGVKKPTKDTPRPMARPVDKTPTPVAAPAKITTTKLAAPAATTKVAGRGGFASGPAAGMPAKKKETPAEREKRISAATPLGKLVASFSGSYTAVPAKPKPKTSITPAKSRKDAIEAAMKKRNK